MGLESRIEEMGYREFREVFKDLTIHEITALVIFDPENKTIIDSDDISLRTRYNVSRFIAERRLLGAYWVNYLMHDLMMKGGIVNYEGMAFSNERGFFDFLFSDLVNWGSKLPKGNEARAYVEEVARITRSGTPAEREMLRGLEALYSTEILSHAFIKRPLSIHNLVPAVVYGGEKLSDSANHKQAREWAKDFGLFMKLLSQPHIAHYYDDSIREVKNGHFYGVEDVFRAEVVFGLDTHFDFRDRLEKGYLSHFSSHPLFEIVEYEDYLDGIKVEPDYTERPRNREYHIKLVLRRDALLKNQYRGLWMPDPVEAHFTQADALVDSELNPDYGRRVYVPKKSRLNGQSPKKNPIYQLLSELLRMTSPVDHNRPTCNENFWSAVCPDPVYPYPVVDERTFYQEIRWRLGVPLSENPLYKKTINDYCPTLF